MTADRRGRMSRLASGRALGIAAADQALSSGSNVLVALVVARSLDLSSLGGYAVAFAVFSLSVELSRAIGAEALAIRIAHVDPDDGVNGVASVALIVGGGAAAVAAVMAAFVDGAVGQAMSMMVIFVPLAVMQDALRNAFITVGRPGRALFSDAIWLVVQAVTLAWLMKLESPNSGNAVAAWGLAAALATLATVLAFGVKIRPRHARLWLRIHRDIWPRLLAEASVRAGLAQITLIIIAAIVGSGEFGRLRAAQIVYGPASMALLLAPMVAVPAAARQVSATAIRVVGRVTATALVAVAGVVAFGALLVPDGIGSIVLGETWVEAKTLIPVTGVMFAASGLVTGAITALRGAGRVDLTLRLRVVSGPLLLAFGALGAVFGIGAAAAAIATSRLALAAVAWSLVRTDAVAPQNRRPVAVR